MIASILNSILHLAIILGVVYVILLLVSSKWKAARPVSSFYGSLIISALLGMAQFLWRSRIERQGGAHVSLPQFEMEDEEWL